MKQAGFLFLFFISFAVFGQQEPNLASLKTTKEKLKAWLQYSTELSDKADYPKLIIACQKGIELAEKHPAYKGRFYLQKGVAYEFSNNQYSKALS